MNSNSAKGTIVSHLFFGENEQLTFQLMAVINAHSSCCHQFIILNPGPLKQRYIDFFSARNIASYVFLEHQPTKLRSSPFLFMRRIGIFLVPTLSYFNLFRIARFSSGRLFLHGIDFNIPTLLLLRCLGVRVGFICWGTIVTRKNIGLQNALLKWNYAWYSKIVCLMVPDKKRFENDFGCANVVCQPYLNEAPGQETNPLSDEGSSSKPTLVVGNSTWSFDMYPEVLDKLPFEKLDRVICMLNYGNESRMDEVDCFVQRYQEKYGGKFFPWRKKVDYETYCKTIAAASVYIAPLRTQTGLGISYLMLKWGRKVYVRGANLEWLKQCGFIVFDLDACDLADAESLLKPLSADEKEHNTAAWDKMFDITSNAEKWDLIYCHGKRIK